MLRNSKNDSYRPGTFDVIKMTHKSTTLSLSNTSSLRNVKKDTFLEGQRKNRFNFIFSLDESSGAFNSPAWVEKIEVYGFSKLPKEVLLTTNGNNFAQTSFILNG